MVAVRQKLVTKQKAEYQCSFVNALLSMGIVWMVWIVSLLVAFLSLVIKFVSFHIASRIICGGPVAEMR